MVEQLREQWEEELYAAPFFSEKGSRVAKAIELKVRAPLHPVQSASMQHYCGILIS